MAMSRSGGATSLTTSPPSRTSPELARSRPAAIRRTVVFPDPDGPTRTRNSPSAMSRSRSSTATVDSLGPRPLDGRDMRAQVRDATTVGDGTVGEPVLEGSAVLGDQQREVAIVSLDPQKQLRERLRHDRPLHRRQLRVLLDLPD